MLLSSKTILPRPLLACLGFSLQAKFWASIQLFFKTFALAFDLESPNALIWEGSPNPYPNHVEICSDILACEIRCDIVAFASFDSASRAGMQR